MNSAFEEGSNRRVLLIFLAIALCACYWLVKPFLEPIILAILIGMLTFPMHDRLVARLNGGHNRQVYTSISQKDIFEKRSILSALTQDGLGDTTPLYKLIRNYVDETFLAEVANQYHRRRLLFIGTTNLDAQQPVIWNMGAIAAANTAEPAELFHQIMLASASIPGAFPPVMIDVEVGGRRYQEMHVDGGVMAQVSTRLRTSH